MQVVFGPYLKQCLFGCVNQRGSEDEVDISILAVLLDHSRTAIAICLGMLKCSKNIENSQI